MERPRRGAAGKAIALLARLIAKTIAEPEQNHE